MSQREEISSFVRYRHSPIFKFSSRSSEPIFILLSSTTFIACSELGLIGEIRKGVISAGVFSTNQTCVDNATYTTFDVLVRPEYAVFVDGTDDLAHHYSSLIAVALDQIKQNNDEKFDRSNFVKNVILDNILPGDIYIKSRELHFNAGLICTENAGRDYALANFSN